MNFEEATTKVLQSVDPSTELRLADDYIAAWKKRGDLFVLPREYAHLKPIIERYSADTKRFLRYVRAVRDEIAEVDGMSSMRYKHLQEFVRTLDVRTVQALRRDRLRGALAWLEREHPGVSTAQKKAWAVRVQQLWQKQRMAWLEAERKQRGGRLSEDERREVLDEFWDTLEQQITEGVLPKL